MAGQQNRLSRFWHELKRRRVIHVITVYASASFAVIEIVNNLTGPLNLPTSLSTIVIIVLAVGFPPAIILSWLYDLTSGTFERTKPLVGAEEEVKPATVPNAWKIATYVSFVVIIGLATLNIIGNGNKLRARDIRSLVILPFENFTGDERMDNMVSSMHSLMIGDMGRISGLRVIGKTSSQVFKDSGKSAKEIARELNVDGVVEATVTCLGDSICMQFRLLDTKGDERQIWVGDYHEDKGQILNMYNRITQLITKEVRIELTEDEKQKLAEKRTLDREAVTAFLKSYVTDLSEESLRKAEDFLNQAVKKDPEWALPYLLLAGTWGSMTQMGYEPPDLGGKKILEYFHRAQELDPDLPGLHTAIAEIAVWTEWDWEKGEREFRKALEINPSDAGTRVFYAHLLDILQRTDEALLQGRIADELEPLDPMIQSLYSVVLGCTGDWKGMLAQLDKALALDPGHYFAKQLVDLAAFNCGDYDRVIPAFRSYMPFPESFFDSVDIVYHQEGINKACEMVAHEMERTGWGCPWAAATVYSYAKQYDRVLDLLEAGYEIHEPNMPYITISFEDCDSVYNNPRFIALVKKMNLPLPKID